MISQVWWQLTRKTILTGWFLPSWILYRSRYCGRPVTSRIINSALKNQKIEQLMTTVAVQAQTHNHCTHTSNNNSHGSHRLTITIPILIFTQTFGAVFTTKSLWEFIWIENSATRLMTRRSRQLSWATSLPAVCYHLHSPSPLIIITVLKLILVIMSHRR